MLSSRYALGFLCNQNYNFPSGYHSLLTSLDSQEFIDGQHLGLCAGQMAFESGVWYFGYHPKSLQKKTSVEHRTFYHWEHRLTEIWHLFSTYFLHTLFCSKWEHLFWNYIWLLNCFLKENIYLNYTHGPINWGSLYLFVNLYIKQLNSSSSPDPTHPSSRVPIPVKGTKYIDCWSWTL